jgi:hypothetical protein
VFPHMKNFGKKIPHVWKFLQGACALGLLGTACPLSAAPKRIVLPPETAGFVLSTGSELAMANCLQCHSAEYITTQPALPLAGWKASLDKMRGKYGAQIAPEVEGALLEYLVKAYGKDSASAK